MIDDWVRGRNRKQQDFKFFEDTHDDFGNYIDDTDNLNQSQRDVSKEEIKADFENLHKQPNVKKSNSISGSKDNDAKPYGNIVYITPKTIEEVEAVIVFLRQGEPAIANLNELDEERAQRVLDFLSGAVFAVDGTICRLSDNIFLLSPNGVKVQTRK